MKAENPDMTTGGRLAAATVGSLLVCATGCSATHPKAPGQAKPTPDAPATAIRFYATGRPPYLTPHTVQVHGRAQFAITVSNNVYALDGHQGATLSSIVILPARDYPRDPHGVSSWSTKHAVFFDHNPLPAGQSRTDVVPALACGNYVVVGSGAVAAWSNIHVRSC